MKFILGITTSTTLQLAQNLHNKRYKKSVRFLIAIIGIPILAPRRIESDFHNSIRLYINFS